MRLDETDKRILQLLQHDSKITTKEISYRLELSMTAIHERIKKLEREKIIANYVAILDKEKVEKNFMVFCHVKLIQHTKENVSKFEREILKLEEVLECFHVSGDYDYILKVYVKNMKAYRSFLVNKLTALNGIGSTQSTFMINEVKNSTNIQL
ncbi:Lrp/AsnC family transcriptional regulator [Mesonia maritima]|uniref:Lrp/AsnC family leucine-responsive transcriptional regulator n=1 Tax=Mesonia maritima TaxID=1793873 RepID=A0ABU1K674_9FLAO|nr:Lrp/AsnC family transcriptional regulator [Mesonia maritima]MDR6301114.1 Lrp/AsnC family leucine-responsive transcriptional regulator [Mesonia maritima]